MSLPRKDWRAAILDGLRAYPRGMTAGELQHYIAPGLSAADVRAALDGLIRSGLVARHERAASGRGFRRGSTITEYFPARPRGSREGPTVSRHTAIYVRVSSKAQDEASQLPDLERFAKGAEGPVVWYRDKFTGTTMDRPGWGKLESAIATGEVARVVVWRLDRFGRTAKGLTALFADLVERGVGMVSMREGIDLLTPAGRLMANVIASVAQYETEVRSERQTAGIAAAREKGVTFGRPKGSGKGRRLKVTPEQDEMAHRMKAEGRKVIEIARATGLSRPTVYSVLRSPAPSTSK